MRCTQRSLRCTPFWQALPSRRAAPRKRGPARVTHPSWCYNSIAMLAAVTILRRAPRSDPPGTQYDDGAGGVAIAYLKRRLQRGSQTKLLLSIKTARNLTVIVKRCRSLRSCSSERSRRISTERERARRRGRVYKRRGGATCTAPLITLALGATLLLRKPAESWHKHAWAGSACSSPHQTTSPFRLPSCAADCA